MSLHQMDLEQGDGAEEERRQIGKGALHELFAAE